VRRSADARRGRLLTVESVAGWVFADLLLVLFLVGLGSTVPVKPPAEPKPPKPVPTARPVPVGMQTKPVVLNVGFNAARLLTGQAASTPERKTVCVRVRKAVKRSGIAHSRAALVLIFAQAAEPTRGVAIAEQLGRQLRCANAGVFKGTPTRAFWKGGVEGQAALEVYLFTTKRSNETKR
jgi:hypothetical protein